LVLTPIEVEMIMVDLIMVEQDVGSTLIHPSQSITNHHCSPD